MYVFGLGGVGGEVVSRWENWVWALPILWGHTECWTCVCVLVAVGRGLGSGSGAVGRCESGFSV